MKGGLLRDFKVICEKKYHKAEKCLKDTFGQGGTQTNVLLLGTPQKCRNFYAKCQ